MAISVTTRAGKGAPLNATEHDANINNIVAAIENTSTGHDHDGTDSKLISYGSISAMTSAQLAGIVSDETGSGALVFANTPTLVTPVLGTPTSGTLTNCTGLPQAGVVGLTTSDGPSFAHIHLTDAIIDNISTNQGATTAWAKSQDAVLARDPDQGVAMTYAASGSTGIAVSDNDNIDFGTGNFTLVWKGSLPDWTPSSAVVLIQKTDGTNGWILQVATSGVLQLVRNAEAAKSSTAAPSITDGTTHEIVCVVTTETASVAGSVVFYVDGVQLGDTVTITAGSPTTVSNSTALYVAGTSSTRSASTTYHAYTFNRALTAAEVLDLYRNGISYADQWGSQTALTSGTLTTGKKYRINTYVSDDDFTNIGAASNASGVEFTATGTTPTHWAHSSSLVEIGATLALIPEGIQADKWYDASSNQLNANYPTTGSSLTRIPDNFHSVVSAKGPAIITTATTPAVAGTVTAAASTTVTFSSANDASLAGYRADGRHILGTTLISNTLTRYIVSWTNATTCVVDSSVTWAGTAITSVQLPISSEVTSASPGVLKRATLADGTEYFVGNVGIGKTSPGARLEVLGSADTSQIIRILKSSTGSARGALGIESGVGYLDLYNDATTKTIRLLANGDSYISSGNVGIGTTEPTSTIHGAGSFALPITTKTADYTAGASDYTILVSCSSANITITLPAVASYVGRIYNIKKIDATGYTVTVDGNSSETIDGALTQVISTQYESLQIQSNGTSWYII